MSTRAAPTLVLDDQFMLQGIQALGEPTPKFLEERFGSVHAAMKAISQRQEHAEPVYNSLCGQFKRKYYLECLSGNRPKIGKDQYVMDCVLRDVRLGAEAIAYRIIRKQYDDLTTTDRIQNIFRAKADEKRSKFEQVVADLAVANPQSLPVESKERLCKVYALFLAQTFAMDGHLQEHLMNQQERETSHAAVPALDAPARAALPSPENGEMVVQQSSANGLTAAGRQGGQNGALSLSPAFYTALSLVNLFNPEILRATTFAEVSETGTSLVQTGHPQPRPQASGALVQPTPEPVRIVLKHTPGSLPLPAVDLTGVFGPEDNHPSLPTVEAPVEEEPSLALAPEETAAPHRPLPRSSSEPVLELELQPQSQPRPQPTPPERPQSTDNTSLPATLSISPRHDDETAPTPTPPERRRPDEALARAAAAFDKLQGLLQPQPRVVKPRATLPRHPEPQQTSPAANGVVPTPVVLPKALPRQEEPTSIALVSQERRGVEAANLAREEAPLPLIPQQQTALLPRPQPRETRVIPAFAAPVQRAAQPETSSGLQSFYENIVRSNAAAAQKKASDATKGGGLQAFYLRSLQNGNKA